VSCLLWWEESRPKLKRLWPASTNTLIFQLHMQFNFTNLTFLHYGFKLWASPSNKSTQNKLHQTTDNKHYWTKQQSMNLCLYQ
jgi:hypothetical protein